MNRAKIMAVVVGLACAVTVLVFAAPPLGMGRPLTIQATNQAPALIMELPAGTNDFLRGYIGGVLRFYVPSNGVLPVAFGGSGATNVAGSQTNLGLITGSAVTTSDGTVTQAFGITFAAAPNVISTQVGLDTTSTNVVEITTSNFIVRTGKATVTNRWFAIGAR
jgi:hypothetical protein